MTSEFEAKHQDTNDANELTDTEELPIPPDTEDHYSKTEVKWRKQDDEPVLYRDKYIAVTTTYLYIFNYYMPDGRDKAIALTSIKNIQTDKEANISWAKDFGRWKGHDLCVIVTVDRGVVKRKGFTLENIKGLHVLKEAWKKANGLPYEDDG
ncbi:14545_t:CDS:2 [Racocetra fulgida]|uniref:14545_t:CDS:1 n=1 Tax=Racocetra fulgida TaxID=60492 RepID=A0A9N9D237_9GLOM|nr:14545_t:CDS:2 [Racocetra fulgida]